MKSPKSQFIAFSAIAAAVTLAAETAAPAPQVQAETPAAATPSELIAMRCLICHGNPAAGAKRLAPPFAMVKMHYDDLDEEAFVKTVSAWIKHPDQAKSRMPGAIRNFGLMPAQVVPDADVKAIAHYLFRTDFPMPGMGRGPRAMASDKKPSTASKDGAADACGTESKEAGESCDVPQQKKSESQCD